MNEAAEMAGWEVAHTEHSPAANLHWNKENATYFTKDYLSDSQM